MSLVVNTYPDNISNSGLYNVTTSLTGDVDHVNLRVRADITIDAVIIATIEKPKGLNTFDFFYILKSNVPGISLARNSGVVYKLSGGSPLVAYTILFTEVYEDANGVTQKGDTDNASGTTYKFVPGVGDDKAFANYVLKSYVSLFASKTLRNNVVKFFPAYEYWLTFFTEVEHVQLFYSKDGGAYDSATTFDPINYWGIIIINTDELMSGVTSNLRIQLGEVGAGKISEVITIYIDNTIIDERTVLEYDGLVGGKEYLAFEGIKLQEFNSIRNYYTGAGRNRKPLSFFGINRQRLETRFKDIYNTEYLESLLMSETVKKLEPLFATPTNVTIITDNVRIASSDMFTNQIDIEYQEGRTVPTITTTPVTSITLTTAVSGGNVTADGGGTVTARGVCWSINENPTTSNNKTSDGSGTGSFTSDLASLTPGTEYYVRAYAINSKGTAYGNQVSFMTQAVQLATLTTDAVSSITQTTAVSGGNITDDGGAEVTARGVCWSTSQSPTTTDNHTDDGSGTGAFISNLIELNPDTNYFVRAYATNSKGTAYGNEVPFTTQAIPSFKLASMLTPSLIRNEEGNNLSASGTTTLIEITGKVGNVLTLNVLPENLINTDIDWFVMSLDPSDYNVADPGYTGDYLVQDKITDFDFGGKRLTLIDATDFDIGEKICIYSPWANYEFVEGQEDAGIITKSGSGWRSTYVAAGPCWYDNINERYVVLVNGRSPSGYEIGYAYSTDFITWYIGNGDSPIIVQSDHANFANNVWAVGNVVELDSGRIAFAVCGYNSSNYPYCHIIQMDKDCTDISISDAVLSGHKYFAGGLTYYNDKYVICVTNRDNGSQWEWTAEMWESDSLTSGYSKVCDILDASYAGNDSIWIEGNPDGWCPFVEEGKLYTTITGTQRYVISGIRGNRVAGLMIYDDNTETWSVLNDFAPEIIFPMYFYNIPSEDYDWAGGHIGGYISFIKENGNCYLFCSFTAAGDDYPIACLKLVNNT